MPSIRLAEARNPTPGRPELDASAAKPDSYVNIRAVWQLSGPEGRAQRDEPSAPRVDRIAMVGIPASSKHLAKSR